MPKKTTTPDNNSTTVSVFVPRGAVRAGDILAAAVMAAEIPDAAMNITPAVATASEPRTDERGIEGRDYTVEITWTPRATRATTAEEEEEIPGTIDKVLDSLEPLTAADIDAVTTPTES